MVERRKHSRLDFPARCSLVVDGHSLNTTLVDISMKGALVEVPEPWDDVPNRKCDLVLQLDESDVSLTMGMEAIRNADGHLGLLCVSIDVDSATHLRRLLELNLGDPSLVERELVEP